MPNAGAVHQREGEGGTVRLPHERVQDTGKFTGFCAFFREIIDLISYD